MTATPTRNGPKPKGIRQLSIRLIPVRRVTAPASGLADHLRNGEQDQRSEDRDEEAAEVRVHGNWPPRDEPEDEALKSCPTMFSYHPCSLSAFHGETVGSKDRVEPRETAGCTM